jgi:hypothetical protein
MVEYFVPGARWTPTYVCRLDSAGNQAAIALRALLCQRTGEDWSGIRLELSTAEPMAWCELPQLPSLRLGRAQSVMRKSGWRLPPIGVQILFEDFDRHKQVALAAVSKHQFISDFSSVSVPAIPNLKVKSELVSDFGIQKTIINEISTSQVGQLINTLIPVDVCSRYRLLPLSKNETQPPSVLVAMVDPDNLDAQDDLNRILRPQGIGLQRMVITLEDYQQVISKYLDALPQQQEKKKFEKSVDVSQDLENLEVNLEDAPDEGEADLGEALRDAQGAPVINLVNRILAKALQKGVSDIHVEPQEESLRIRFRKDGVLRQAFDPLPKKIQPAVAARVKIMAKLDIAERRLPQNGKIRRTYQGRQVDFFVYTVPTRYGEKIVLSLQAPTLFSSEVWIGDTSISDHLAYGFMRLGAADDPSKRGNLSIEQRHEAYLEILKRRKVVVTFDVMEVVQQAISNAQNCIYVNLPTGGINVRQVAGSFDYAYSAEGRVDVPSDGEFHSVALTSNSTDVDVRYVVVPREDTNVFRIAQLRNPLQAPLLAGPADVYVDGEYILSTNIATVPPKGQMELGLGVEQAIKVARNTTYQEVRSGETLVAFNELRHHIQIDIANRLPREARIEVRERLPIPSEDAKVDVQIGQVSPEWEKYEQQERGTPIKGGYRWRLQVPAKEEKTL